MKKIRLTVIVLLSAWLILALTSCTPAPPVDISTTAATTSAGDETQSTSSSISSSATTAVTSTEETRMAAILSALEKSEPVTVDTVSECFVGGYTLTSTYFTTADGCDYHEEWLGTPGETAIQKSEGHRDETLASAASILSRIDLTNILYSALTSFQVGDVITLSGNVKSGCEASALGLPDGSAGADLTLICAEGTETVTSVKISYTAGGADFTVTVQFTY